LFALMGDTARFCVPFVSAIVALNQGE